jgi:hypothetical protein
MWPLSAVCSPHALLPRSDVCASVCQVERWLDEDGHVLQPSNFKYPQVRLRAPPHRAARLGSARLSSARLTQVRQCDPLCDSLISHVRMCFSSFVLSVQCRPAIVSGQTDGDQRSQGTQRAPHTYTPRALAHTDSTTSRRWSVRRAHI